MKRLLTAAALVLSITNAHALQQIRSGSWVAYAGPSETGLPTCGMTVTGGGRDLHVKYQPVGEGNTIYFQLFKQTWRFGAGNDVPVVLGFDKNEMIKATARTFNTKQGSTVEFNIKGELAVQFLHEFGEADKMWVRFDAGTESPWVADMTGSRKAMQLFAQCISGIEKPTVPFGDKPQASQPFDDKIKPTSPTSPAKAKKKDDGSI